MTLTRNIILSASSLVFLAAGLPGLALDRYSAENSSHRLGRTFEASRSKGSKGLNQKSGLRPNGGSQKMNRDGRVNSGGSRQMLYKYQPRGPKMSMEGARALVHADSKLFSIRTLAEFAKIGIGLAGAILIGLSAGAGAGFLGFFGVWALASIALFALLRPKIKKLENEKKLIKAGQGPDEYYRGRH